MSWCNIDITDTGACTSSLATELAPGIACCGGRQPREDVTNINTLPHFRGSSRTANNAAVLCEAHELSNSLYVDGGAACKYTLSDGGER